MEPRQSVERYGHTYRRVGDDAVVLTWQCPFCESQIEADDPVTAVEVGGYACNHCDVPMVFAGYFVRPGRELTVAEVIAADEKVEETRRIDRACH